MVTLLLALALADPLDGALAELLADPEPVVVVPKAAPALPISHWMGEAPDLSQGTVVVEVWATWCGACRESFPELSHLAEQYADRLTVVGLTDEDPVRVRRFYEGHRSEMRYPVAVGAEAVEALLFGDYAGSGIPSVYVIRDEKMLWSGHPGGLRVALGAAPLSLP
jgi:thiol-disulfide isomerase/thioredoxin